MSRVDLPDGEWAEFLEPRKVPEKKRRPYVRGMEDFMRAIAQLPRGADGKTADQKFWGSEHSDLFDMAMDALVMAFLKAWSFETPITLDAVQDLPGDTYDALRVAAGRLSNDLRADPEPSPKETPPTGG